jgi:hypothetical protein
MTNILFPGRHHLMTEFQFRYLRNILRFGLKDQRDVNGELLGLEDKVDSIIFAVTSANHSNTRRNPLPLYQRSMILHAFSEELDTDAFVYDIDDVGVLEGDEFAEYTIKRIKSRSDNRFDLTPENTVVLCSTPVLEMYERLGFKILPAELKDRKTWEFKAELPWDIVETIANSEGDWRWGNEAFDRMHHASKKVWSRYNVGDKVRLLFSDKMIGDDGDITETRDYNTYVRQLDENAEIKHRDTAPYIKPGRIGDIGCAVGSWIKLASEDQRLWESEFYGVEVARKLFEECEHRKERGDFKNPFVFFSRKNAVSGSVFDPDSMDTIHTSSLTHEIESYAGRKDLLQFIQNRFQELSHGGVWINRDVIGPEHKDGLVYMRLNEMDGIDHDYNRQFEDRKELAKYLGRLSTFTRFLRFAQDFRHEEGYKVDYEIESDERGEEFVKIRLSDACEFMSKKDYTDNWQSEMHETFCFWDINEWKQAVEEAGFIVKPESRAFTNQWIVENRFKGKVELYRKEGTKLVPMDYPVTNMILIGEKQ